MDITNAYGSIPHGHLFHLLRVLGVHANYIGVLRDLYARQRTDCDVEPPVTLRIGRGLPQGDPISPLLANVYFNLFLYNLPPELTLTHSSGTTIAACAYADDILLVSSTARGLQLQLDSVSRTGAALHLAFNVEKSRLLAMEAGKHLEVGSYFRLQGNVLASNADDIVKYLGCPYDVTLRLTSDSTDFLRTVRLKCNKIFTSRLRQWQQLDAVRQFVMPCLTYGLRETNPSVKAVKELSRDLGAQLRTAIVDGSYPHAFLHQPVGQGGTGVVDPLIQYATLSISGGLQLLNYPQDKVARMARYDAIRSPHTLHVPLDLDNPITIKRPTHSPWSRLKMGVLILRDLGFLVQLVFPTDPFDLHNAVDLIMNGVRSPLGQEQQFLMDTISDFSTKVYISQHPVNRIGLILQTPALLQLVHQMRGFTLTSWRFMWNSRFYHLPSDQSQRPCACKAKRSTAHEQSIMCRSRARRNLVMERHNGILQLLATALNDQRGLTVETEKAIPLAPDVAYRDSLRPDIIVKDSINKNIWVCDVQVSMYPDQAYQHKVTKYEAEVRIIAANNPGFSTHAAAYVITPFGSVWSLSHYWLANLPLQPDKCRRLEESIISLVLRKSGDLTFLTEATCGTAAERQLRELPAPAAGGTTEGVQPHRESPPHPHSLSGASELSSPLPFTPTPSAISAPRSIVDLITTARRLTDQQEHAAAALAKERERLRELQARRKATKRPATSECPVTSQSKRSRRDSAIIPTTASAATTAATSATSTDPTSRSTQSAGCSAGDGSPRGQGPVLHAGDERASQVTAPTQTPHASGTTAQRTGVRFGDTSAAIPSLSGTVSGTVRSGAVRSRNHYAAPGTVVPRPMAGDANHYRAGVPLLQQSPAAGNLRPLLRSGCPARDSVRTTGSGSCTSTPRSGIATTRGAHPRTPNRVPGGQLPRATRGAPSIFRWVRGWTGAGNEPPGDTPPSHASGRGGAIAHATHTTGRPLSASKPAAEQSVTGRWIARTSGDKRRPQADAGQADGGRDRSLPGSPGTGAGADRGSPLPGSLEATPAARLG